MEIEVTVQSQKEFDDAIQRYIESGYELESNTEDNAVLRKKGFKLWIFIVLLLFLIIGAILYYFLSDDNVVVLKRVSNSNHYYCRECGVSLTDDAKFCPKFSIISKSYFNLGCPVELHLFYSVMCG